MKVLIISGCEQVRSALEAQLTSRGRAFHSANSEWVTSAAKLGAESKLSLPAGIDVVVYAMRLNTISNEPGEEAIESLPYLLTLCSKNKIPFIYLSSSIVFHGLTGGRHRESAGVNLESDAVSSLVKAEELVRDQSSAHIILRTGPLYSSNGNNLLTNLLAEFDKNSPMSLSNVGKCSPVHTSDLARVVSALIDQLSCGCDSWGTYHYSSSDPVSSYQFAEVLLAVLSQYSDISENSLQLEPLDQVDDQWVSPLLNCEKIFDTFGIKQLPWRSFVTQTMKEILDGRQKEMADE